MADTAFHQFTKWRRLWQEKRCCLLLLWSAHKFFSFSPRLGIVSPVIHFLFIRQTLLETLQLLRCMWVFTKEPKKHPLLSYSTVLSYDQHNLLASDILPCCLPFTMSLLALSYLDSSVQVLWSLTLSREENQERIHSDSLHRATLIFFNEGCLDRMSNRRKVASSHYLQLWEAAAVWREGYKLSLKLRGV